MAVIKPGSAALYYIHSDHLDTPRLIANQTPATVWRWDNDDPFGANMANANPSGLGTFAFNLRLPGQYFDSETNYHYNYYRDYSPEIGRYIQSDPIGLRAGLNTYAYAYDDPLRFDDPRGLAPAGTGTLLEELGNLLREQGIIATSPARKIGTQCGQTLCARGTPGGPRDPLFDENVTQLCLPAVQAGQGDVSIGVLEECKNVCKAYIKKNCNPNVVGCVL